MKYHLHNIYQDAIQYEVVPNEVHPQPVQQASAPVPPAVHGDPPATHVVEGEGAGVGAAVLVQPE